jgi:hypothetical protein
MIGWYLRITRNIKYTSRTKGGFLDVTNVYTHVYWWLYWAYWAYSLLQRTACYSVQPATAHSLLQRTACYKAQPATAHSLLQRTACYNAQPAIAHSLLQRTACYSAHPATAHSLLQRTACYSAQLQQLLQWADKRPEFFQFSLHFATRILFWDHKCL